MADEDVHVTDPCESQSVGCPDQVVAVGKVDLLEDANQDSAPLSRQISTSSDDPLPLPRQLSPVPLIATSGPLHGSMRKHFAKVPLGEFLPMAP